MPSSHRRSRVIDQLKNVLSKGVNITIRADGADLDELSVGESDPITSLEDLGGGGGGNTPNSTTMVGDGDVLSGSGKFEPSYDSIEEDPDEGEDAIDPSLEDDTLSINADGEAGLYRVGFSCALSRTGGGSISPNDNATACIMGGSAGVYLSTETISVAAPVEGMVVLETHMFVYYDSDQEFSTEVVYDFENEVQLSNPQISASKVV